MEFQVRRQACPKRMFFVNGRVVRLRRDLTPADLQRVTSELRQDVDRVLSARREQRA